MFVPVRYINSEYLSIFHPFFFDLSDNLSVRSIWEKDAAVYSTSSPLGRTSESRKEGREEGRKETDVMERLEESRGKTNRGTNRSIFSQKVRWKDSALTKFYGTWLWFNFYRRPSSSPPPSPPSLPSFFIDANSYDAIQPRRTYRVEIYDTTRNSLFHRPFSRYSHSYRERKSPMI